MGKKLEEELYSTCIKLTVKSQEHIKFISLYGHAVGIRRGNNSASRLIRDTLERVVELIKETKRAEA